MVQDSTKGIIKWGAAIAASLFCFFAAAVILFPKYTILAALLYGLANIMLITGVYALVSGRVNHTLSKLSDMVQALIDGKEKTLFPIAEDTILSKLQVQVFKLYDILRSYEEREQIVRRQISENIGDLVHQINTPITNIELYAHFLEREDLTEEERKNFIRSILAQSKKLTWLGEGFSKISRLETGIIRLIPEEQKVLPVILKAVDQIMPKAERKNMNLLLTGDEKLIADIDRKWTEEAFFNVLDNAVKYGFSDTEIEINMTDMSNYICVCITNTGISIKAEDYHKIFKRFYRGTNAADKEGVGLGLYLAREILSGQKGYIKAESSREGRNTFSLYLFKKI